MRPLRLNGSRSLDLNYTGNTPGKQNRNGRGGQMTNGYSERDMQIWQEIGRHDERIKDLESDYAAMKDVLQRIYFALAGIAGGVIVSLILLVINLTAGTG